MVEETGSVKKEYVEQENKKEAGTPHGRASTMFRTSEQETGKKAEMPATSVQAEAKSPQKRTLNFT